MEKTYVVFVGRKPSVYGTWAETYDRVNGFSGTLHKSFRNRKDALKAFKAYKEKQCPTPCFKSGTEESSCATSSASSERKYKKAEEIAMLEDAMSDLENEHHKHTLRFAEKMEEIKQMIKGILLRDALGDDGKLE